MVFNLGHTREERTYPSDQDYALSFALPEGFRLHIFGLQFKRWTIDFELHNRAIVIDDRIMMFLNVKTASWSLYSASLFVLTVSADRRISGTRHEMLAKPVFLLANWSNLHADA